MKNLAAALALALLIASLPPSAGAADTPAPVAADSTAHVAADSTARVTTPASADHIGVADLPPHAAVADSATHGARVDAAAGPRSDSTPHVRVPRGADPTKTTPVVAVKPPTHTKEGMPVPGQRFFLLTGLGVPADARLARGWNVGGMFGGGLDLTYVKRFSLRLRAEWAQLPIDEYRILKNLNLYGIGLRVEGGPASLVSFSLLPRWQTTGSWPRWFAEAGPSLGMARVADAFIYDPFYGQFLYESPGQTSFAAGMSAGSGIELLRRDGSGVFLDVHWNALFTQRGGTKQYVPITVGIIFPQ